MREADLKNYADANRLVNDGLITVNEAARFLGLCRSTVYNLMNQGLLPWVKIGRSRRLPRLAVVAFVADLLKKHLVEYDSWPATFGDSHDTGDDKSG
jgi:excisionase family DNA binding protein